MRSRLIAGFLALLVFWGPASIGYAADSASPADAEAFVRKLSDDAVAVLSNQDLSLEEREVGVRGMLENHLAIRKIGLLILTKKWRKVEKERMDEYMGLITEYLLRKYARLLGGYSGQSITVVKAGKVGKRDALVETVIKQEGAEPINVGWRVRNNGESLEILDVLVERISMLQTERQQFGSVLKREKFDGLIEILRLKVTKFAAKSG